MKETKTGLKNPQNDAADRTVTDGAKVKLNQYDTIQGSKLLIDNSAPTARTQLRLVGCPVCWEPLDDIDAVADHLETHEPEDFGLSEGYEDRPLAELVAGKVDQEKEKAETVENATDDGDNKRVLSDGGFVDNSKEFIARESMTDAFIRARISEAYRTNGHIQCDDCPGLVDLGDEGVANAISRWNQHVNNVHDGGRQ